MPPQLSANLPFRRSEIVVYVALFLSHLGFVPVQPFRRAQIVAYFDACGVVSEPSGFDPVPY